MAQRPDLTRYLDAGAQFVALTRAQARARAKELVNQGQLAQEQVQGFVDELVDESRRRTDEMLDVVRREIQRQMKSLGIATKDDLGRLESRIAARGPAKQTAGAAKRAAKSTKKATKKSAKKTAKKTAKRATTATKKKSATATRASNAGKGTKAAGTGAKGSRRSGA
jgi:polyhydroxyalkanoate synthesis regulator phasin